MSVKHVIRNTLLIGATFWLGTLARTCPAQVVFLPTWHQFSVGGSWSIPDQGSATAGRIYRSRSGSTGRSTPGLGRLPGLNPLFGNRDFGRSMSGGQASVHVTVIDLAAIDAAILGRGSKPAGVNELRRRQGKDLQERLSSSRKRSKRDVAGDLSLAEIRRMRAERIAASETQTRSPPERTRTSAGAKKSR